MLIVRLEKRNISEEEEHQFILKGRETRKEVGVDLEQK